MWRFGHDSEAKSQLVVDICSISNSTIACSHRSHCIPAPINSHFVDWYRILGVAEDAGMDAIRKRYHKLALQLHPDKNHHPKAEVAFKLVSEAYACLSDSLRRRTFNMERWKRFCTKCNRIPYITCNPSIGLHEAKLETRAQVNNSRSSGFVGGFKDIRDRFREEARVIENCLRTNRLSRKESQPLYTSDDPSQSKVKQNTQKESPIFDPCNYTFQGYPHLRSHVHKKPENFWNFRRGSIKNCEQGTEKHQTPIFGNASIRGMFKSKSGSVRTCEQGTGKHQTPIFSNASIRGMFKSKSSGVHS